MFLTYGKKITKLEADGHFDLVMNIKEKAHDKIKGVLQAPEDKNALRYYCGKQADYNTDLCFLFSTEILQDLLRAITINGGKGIAVFNAVRTESDSPTGEEDPIGRPTVMIFPFKTEVAPTPEHGVSGGDKFDDEDIVILGDEGYEHPGTGGKPPGGGITRNSSGKFELPTRFKGSEIWKIV